MTCPGCGGDTQWAGGLGVYVPQDGGQPQPYSLCEACSQRMAHGDCEEISRRVDQHFTVPKGKA